MANYDVEKFLATLPPYLPPKEAAKVKRCSLASIYNQLNAGRLRAVKDGAKTLIETRSLVEDMESLPAWVPEIERQPQRKAIAGPAPTAAEQHGAGADRQANANESATA
jgi:hypothetical protein